MDTRTTEEIIFDRMKKNLDGYAIELDAYKKLADELGITLEEMLLFSILKHLDRISGQEY